jgi:Holliday junction resolvase
MPNKNYIKGRRKEYKVVNEAKAKGCLAFRSAGSHSPIDVAIISPIEGRIWLVQCKSDNMPESEKKRLERTHKDLNGTFDVTFEVI